ncbi:DUF1403 family protein [Hoeflea sp.]|uniref:DUF1403 family protein n=1 Tax=Hoeflea sp. TaxID=1940281 RepID=UPI003B01BB7F
MPLISDHMREDVYGWLEFTWDDRHSMSRVAAAADLLATVIELNPREESVAFLLADLRLARDLNWPSLFPFTAQYLTGKELRGSRDELLINCHRSIYTVATNAVRMAYDLARRAERVRAIAPKLRTRHSDEALELFLSEVAIAPSSMLAPRIKGTNFAKTPRAARRFCDRLVQLGVAHELTGRETFRLYGIAP